MQGTNSSPGLRKARNDFVRELQVNPPKVLKLDRMDNVVVALADLPAGEPVVLSGTTYIPVSRVPAKHKFAEKDLAAGAEVIMYGVVVGRALEPIPQGGRITIRNVQHQASHYSDTVGEYHWHPPDVSRWQQRTFLGYHRPDGQVGTRNYWLVVPLVFCENRNIEVLKEAFEDELGYGHTKIYRQKVKDLARLYQQQGNISEHAAARNHASEASERIFGNIDGIKFLTHHGGCGGTRDDARTLCGLLAGYIHHPNVAGATILSLGCQNAQASILREELAARDPGIKKPVIVLSQQSYGLESALLSQAIADTFAGLVEANERVRAPAAIANLTVGLKCGGSDGFSGISANPAIGHVSDMLAALGARSILSEFPELCGVEQSIINRCANQTLADRFTGLMRDYAARANAVHSGFDMNPSPGNIQDGLITDAMKSAGAARKSGTSPVNDVLDYPQYATTPGLNLLCTPGNDVECVTAQVGAGANLVLFTTGLGTPTGNPIAPVVKISTNTPLARKMSDIIDIDTGSILTGETTIAEAGEEILDWMLEVASGRKSTKAEMLGQNDFIPWKRGISL